MTTITRSRASRWLPRFLANGLGLCSRRERERGEREKGKPSQSLFHNRTNSKRRPERRRHRPRPGMPRRYLSNAIMPTTTANSVALDMAAVIIIAVEIWPAAALTRHRLDRRSTDAGGPYGRPAPMAHQSPFAQKRCPCRRLLRECHGRHRQHRDASRREPESRSKNSLTIYRHFLRSFSGGACPPEFRRPGSGYLRSPSLSHLTARVCPESCGHGDFITFSAPPLHAARAVRRDRRDAARRTCR